MSEINSLSLKVFAEILRNGSFEAAARKLHITPSAVSQRIRQLEDQLGQVLIVRGIPSRPTDAGRKLFRHAQQIQSMEDDFFNELNQATDYKISVAVNMDSMDGWFLDVITEAASSGIMLNLKAEDQAFSESMLREGKVMAAVSTNSRPIQGCSTELLGTMYYTACASVSFCKQFFSEGDRVENLITSPAICFNEKDGLQHEFLKSVAGRDVEPITMFIPSNTAYIEAIHRGVGWGMLPDFISNRHLNQGTIVKLIPEFAIAVNLYWIRWNTRITALDRLSECVRSAAKKHLRID
ncbi:LysR family transcriptional regulator ArgP [Citrobacter amalonaticus]|uniref:LysR family transcriptional regulator ArgP n=1 Tax=Citrobacter amalonaticus TaxID=35703 RepID=UPI001904B543|nr:LysR family transcriptional regulator ArgP [Citrobacter amalonaticus]MBJ9260670.1 LysR family transcriptional regulator ArgP [Citrobacter amalonaticus]